MRKIKDSKIVYYIFPPCSKRRKLTRVILKTFRHPMHTIKKLNPRDIKSFIRFLNADTVNMRFHPELGKMKPRHHFSDYQSINFRSVESPMVSIIIPVHNQFVYTYNCLSSIKKNSGDIPYEVIIANDCSTDETIRLEELAKNIIMINNDTNLRFLLNCNHAAKHAKGKYILFLNNDTYVQENWLQPLVDLIEQDESIGMVGSKLVYADGMLQEAGGILWRDGSAWNYGNGQNPMFPEFNYVKETDYISGASIMIKKALWDEIGGFDERFAPAYYEDSDLAFEVRKHGYKVLYQPMSVVVHFEGISNGKNLNLGQKAYQNENKKKFYEKWQEELEKNHESNGQHVFCARDRSFNKKTVLVIDHYVPEYDKDAGGKCTYMYMKLFVKMGLNVVFIGDNFSTPQPYTNELQQMGIEVLFGQYYMRNWLTWLQDNANDLDYAYLNRPHIASKYIDSIKKYTNAIIVYFGHDLHYLREYRHYEITKNNDYLINANEWKKKEFKIIDMADLVYVVGSFEYQILHENFPEKPIRNIPVFMYKKLEKGIKLNFKEREDIIFVGGFNHPPNVDAVEWFAKNIFPNIRYHYPDLKWYIVGSNPPESVLNLQSNNIIVTGFVSDSELNALYKKCRLAIVPLRVGAGVKGKVVEAAYNQIPLVTTSIGAEGLSLEENAFLIADTEVSMIDTISELYMDFNRLEELSRNCIKFINNHFTEDVAWEIVSKDFVC